MTIQQSNNRLNKFLMYLLTEQEGYEKDAYGIDYVMNEPTRKKIPHKDLNLFKNEGYHNILAVLKKATKQEIDYWSNWYQYANGHVQEIATQYDIPLEVAAAVVAVLSPNLGWKMNLMAARRVVDNWMVMGGAEGYEWHDKIPAYKSNVNKAYKILKTGDISIVNGPKVTVFFESLLDPNKQFNDLVLDGHAINVWRGLKTPLKGLKSPNKVEREAIIQDYRKVADIVGLTPQQVQAVTWFIWKSVKEPPTIKGHIDVEQPAMKEARRKLGLVISEQIKEIFGSMAAVGSTKNSMKHKGMFSSRTPSAKRKDSITSSDVESLLRSVDNAKSKTTDQIASQIMHKLDVDKKDKAGYATIVKHINSTLSR